LGPVFAAYSVVTAFLSGIFCGSAVNFFSRDEKETGHRSEECPYCAARKRNVFRRIVEYGFMAIPRDINKALFVGILLSGVFGALVPENYFAARCPEG